MKHRRILSMILLFALLFPLLSPRAMATESLRGGQVTLTSGTLNVRSSPSTSGQRLTSLSNGSYVTLLNRSGAWWRVEYAHNKFGYVHGDYIRALSAQVHTVTANGLNVRSGPGTGYTAQTALPRGRQVVVLSTSGTWSRILYHGTKTGYVSSKYLSGAENPGYAPISLSVPDFKQTDPRWANVTLGSSGKPIRTIGCATTGIAMLESHRTGRTIYPDAMAAQLRYTASGNVYWPSHYTVNTSSQSLLQRLYSLLQQGKPILLGQKKSNGGQHWVVVTGFAGGDLTAANFLIQDPGSSSRTRLDQFQSAFPVFYKYFHY